MLKKGSQRKRRRRREEICQSSCTQYLPSNTIRGEPASGTNVGMPSWSQQFSRPTSKRYFYSQVSRFHVFFYLPLKSSRFSFLHSVQQVLIILFTDTEQVCKFMILNAFSYFYLGFYFKLPHFSFAESASFDPS